MTDSKSGWTQVTRALHALACDADTCDLPRIALIYHAEAAWASGHFAGARHTVALGFGHGAGQAATEAYIARLPDHDFDLPGLIVADAHIIKVERDFAAGTTIVVAELLIVKED